MSLIALDAALTGPSGMPDAARDIKLNLQAVLTGPVALSQAERWGVALASAFASRCDVLTRALLAEGRPIAGGAVVEDAEAAASVMAMTNVYYRFRHMVGKPTYAERPARLRMNRLAHPQTSKAAFDLMALAVSAINGCEACIRAHEAAVLEGGLTEEHVHDAVRIASTVYAAAVALSIGEVEAEEAMSAAS